MEQAGDRSDRLQVEGPDGLVDGDVLTLYPRAVGVLLPYVVVYLLGVIAVVVGWVFGGGWVWENWLFLAALVLLTGLRLWIMRAVTRPEWSVRIDAGGVTWFGATQPLVWAAVDHVVVKDRARWWRICGVYGEVGLVDHTAAAFARRAHSAPMRHLIELRLIKGDIGEVVDAISRHAPQLITKSYLPIPGRSDTSWHFPSWFQLLRRRLGLVAPVRALRPVRSETIWVCGGG